MSMIHFVGGEKGGVGKSVFSRLLSQYFIDNNIPYLGLDADQSHQTLTRYYKDFTESINLDKFESTDKIMEMALEEERNIVVDLPAQSERFLNRWIEENDVVELCEEMEVTIVYWYLVDGGNDSVELLDQFLLDYNDVLECIVVKNQGRGVDFSLVEKVVETVSKESFKEPKEILLPALHPTTMDKIDKLNFSFWGAANVKDTPKHLSLMERQRTKVWSKKAYALLDEVLQTL